MQTHQAGRVISSMLRSMSSASIMVLPLSRHVICVKPERSFPLKSPHQLRRHCEGQCLHWPIQGTLYVVALHIVSMYMGSNFSS